MAGNPMRKKPASSSSSGRGRGRGTAPGSRGRSRGVSAPRGGSARSRSRKGSGRRTGRGQSRQPARLPSGTQRRGSTARASTDDLAGDDAIPVRDDDELSEHVLEELPDIDDAPEGGWRNPMPFISGGKKTYGKSPNERMTELRQGHLFE